jgi:hypothetical protein
MAARERQRDKQLGIVTRWLSWPTVVLAGGVGLSLAANLAQAQPPPGAASWPLVFSAWDSATRNAAVAVVNSGSTCPRRRPRSGDVPGDRGRRLEGAAGLPGAGAGVGVPAVRRRRPRVIGAGVRVPAPWQVTIDPSRALISGAGRPTSRWHR